MKIADKLSLLTVKAIISFIEDSDFHFTYAITDGIAGDTFHYKLGLLYNDASIGQNISVIDIYFYVDKYNDVVEVESPYSREKLKNPNRSDVYLAIKQTVKSFVDNQRKKDQEILDNLSSLSEA